MDSLFPSHSTAPSPLIMNHIRLASTTEKIIRNFPNFLILAHIITPICIEFETIQITEIPLGFRCIQGVFQLENCIFKNC